MQKENLLNKLSDNQILSLAEMVANKFQISDETNHKENLQSLKRLSILKQVDFLRQLLLLLTSENTELKDYIYNRAEKLLLQGDNRGVDIAINIDVDIILLIISIGYVTLNSKNFKEKLVELFKTFVFDKTNNDEK